MPQKIKVVVFDMDGVVFERPNFWLDLHHAYGTAIEGQALADRYLLSDYDALVAEVAGRLWKGKPVEPYCHLIEERAYSSGMQACVRDLRNADVVCAILSSGPLPLAERAQRELGFVAVRANAVHADDGHLTGEASIQVPDGEKAAVGMELLASLGFSASDAAFVGDSDSDVAFARTVSIAAAYSDRSDALRSAARIHLKEGQLARLPVELRQCGVV